MQESAPGLSKPFTIPTLPKTPFHSHVSIQAVMISDLGITFCDNTAAATGCTRRPIVSTLRSSAIRFSTTAACSWRHVALDGNILGVALVIALCVDVPSCVVSVCHQRAIQGHVSSYGDTRSMQLVSLWLRTETKGSW